MPAREARDGATHVLDMVQSALSQFTHMFLLYTDAEKAFDRIDWTFICIGNNWVGSTYASLD